MIAAGILFFFSAGLVAKMVFMPDSGANGGSTVFQPAAASNPNLESQVKLVAANFKCACGQCAELFLVDCTCDMPRGAGEEKRFIRNQLRQGMTVEQVIELTDRKYGHRIS